jgi:hypothetical protein
VGEATTKPLTHTSLLLFGAPGCVMVYPCIAPRMSSPVGGLGCFVRSCATPRCFSGRSCPSLSVSSPLYSSQSLYPRSPRLTMSSAAPSAERAPVGSPPQQPSLHPLQPTPCLMYIDRALPVSPPLHAPAHLCGRGSRHSHCHRSHPLYRPSRAAGWAAGAGDPLPPFSRHMSLSFSMCMRPARACLCAAFCQVGVVMVVGAVVVVMSVA